MLSSKPNSNYNALHYNLWQTGIVANSCAASIKGNSPSVVMCGVVSDST